ncbi:MAG TPA: hypothetical protein DHW42_04795 [Candidatus Marinimicrobia bacterium]|nr:hypothetical protein [Candidatus Neomarinimicrobiota bacterium]
MIIVLFEDEFVKDLYPITLTRPAFEIPVGGLTLIQLLRRKFPKAQLRFQIRDELKRFYDYEKYNPDLAKEDVVYLNARAVPSLKNMENLKAGAEKLDLLTYPHETIIWHKRICKETIDFLAEDSRWTEIKKGLFVGEDVHIDPDVRFNTGPGKILIDDHTSIGAFSLIEGPVLIGKNCRVREHSDIKDRVTIGDVCKIRGEITETVFMNYSNKQHYGFIGNAFIGEWVNLGAGTCNSDLKNTYGEIRVRKGQDKINTGEQFLGCIIGDFSKSAINTSIFTGKTIGVSSYLYGFIDEDVPSFVNFMKYFDCGCSTFFIEKAIETQVRMFKRRNIQQTQENIDSLRWIYEETKREREEFLSSKKST